MMNSMATFDQNQCGKSMTLKVPCTTNCSTSTDGEWKTLLRRSEATEGKHPAQTSRQVAQQLWALNRDNALAYALFVRQFLASTKTTVIFHPPYSPDLAPL
jgi:hypothetical protein